MRALLTVFLAVGLGGWISRETSVSGLDFGLSNIALARVLGLPMIFWYGVVLVLVFGFFLKTGFDALRTIARAMPA